MSMRTWGARAAARRTQKLLKRERDDKLRSAITLYHLAPSFYPTNVRGANEEHLTNEVTESILGPFMNERTGRPFVQFSTINELRHQKTKEEQYGRRDAMGEVADLYESSALSGSFISKMSSSMSAASSSPAAARAGDVRAHFVKPLTAYPTRRARDTAGLGEMYAHDELTARSAQVRDALYGTVGGELPGLEIVRDYEREWDADKKKK